MVKSILDSCIPRDDILKGTFNPEIFTASLGAVIKVYLGAGSGLHSVYSNAENFFQDATYPSQGLKTVVQEVFLRLSGNNTVPAIHRLETGFGGGKTHTLIACTHIGFRGNELSAVVGDILDPMMLPAPGEVRVVGIAGDKLPVHKPKGTQLLPHTLWGEIAFQVGGEFLYRAVEQDAESYAAPGENYFEAVFAGRKVLLMIDELAQYAARFSAALPEARQQLEAFLLPLHGYAREHAGLAIVETLASARDAFAKQTKLLAELLSQVTGKDIDQDAALGIGQQAIDGISSVVARDATAVVPVQHTEISRVLAKRLFTRIDNAAAVEAADLYAEMYRKNSSMLPDEATRTDYRERLSAMYPFHPTLINFLNNKLATYENFQSTRGVLRVLALAVRAIWEKQKHVPMIQTCHLDLRDTRTVNEVIGRTGAGDLLAVLNADVGGADTDSLTGGLSNAEIADRRNPHPEGWTMYEYTWKTVFLHSLVGREQEIGSNIFGLTEQDALLEVSFPGLTPPQVSEALKEIGNSAFYLRFNQGRYYASLDPSVNIALAKIRRSLATLEIDALLDAVSRKVVSADAKAFKVVHDVGFPENIPDNTGKPVLAIVGLNAGEVDINDMVTTAGPNRPRLEQNHVVILIPETVTARVKRHGQEPLFGIQSETARTAAENLKDLARTVLAMRKLDNNPQAHGIQPQKLQSDDFKQRYREREKAIETVVTESYRQLWYPSAGGQIVFKEIRTAGGETGMAVLEQIRKTLVEDGELITPERVNGESLASLRKLFFSREETVRVGVLRENFARLRNWPMLESRQVLDQVIRDGVARGMWCLFLMGGEQQATRPEMFFSREDGGVPLHQEIKDDQGIVTPEGATQRGWTKGKEPDTAQVENWVQTVSYEMQSATVNQIQDIVTDRFGAISNEKISAAVSKLMHKDRILAYKGTVNQEEKPELIGGDGAVFFKPDQSDVIITPASAAEKGWITHKKKDIQLFGKEGAAALLPLLRRIGSIYQKGGKTGIKLLDLTELALPAGGTLRISLMDATPESLKASGELFEVLDALIKNGEQTEAFIEINDPQEDCPFLEELLKGKPAKVN
jgi:hypothetical protein